MTKRKYKIIKLSYWLAAVNLILGQLIFLFFIIGLGFDVKETDTLHFWYFITSAVLFLISLWAVHSVRCAHCGERFHGKMFKGKFLNNTCLNCGQKFTSDQLEQVTS